MKIAFITYEYPPDTADGGIATYVQQAAHILTQRGHHVEVFCASRERTERVMEGAVVVHRLLIPERSQFSQHIAPLFVRRHKEVGFDVLEGPDYQAEAYEATRLVPDIPLVVRLHTPNFLARRVRDAQLPLPLRVRLRRRAVRHKEKPSWNPYSHLHEIERLYIQEADELVGISQAITKLVGSLLHLDPNRINRIPNPYVPKPELLHIPLETHTQTVTFLGRLQLRKGVLDLALAIPMVLHCYPQARFRFVGRPLDSPIPGLDMRAYLTRKLWAWRSKVEFLNAVPLDSIPEVLAATDICVFPSLWENFPYVCLEAMAAGRGVIGSSAGGMREILDGGKAGCVVPPQRPRILAKTILRLLQNPSLRVQLGATARQRVLTEYSAERIGPAMEQSYLRAIARRHNLGPRLSSSSLS